MVTRTEIQHIAKLSKLSFSEEELVKFEKEFNSILEYVSLIKECDVSGIEFEHNMDDFKGQVLNEDIPKRQVEPKNIIKVTTKGKEKLGYVRTSKIIDK